jgi:ABC-type transport system substrate-binding protein
MFTSAELDLVDLPGDVAPKMIDSSGQLLPEFAKRGIILDRGAELTTTFSYFNMEDPIVGGYTPEKVALRRAICSAYNVNDEIRVIRNGQGIVATQPIPPGMDGHIPEFKGFASYDPAAARALLDKFGYRDRNGDGYRELPDGKPLSIRQTTAIGAIYRQFDDLWSRNMREIGVRMDFEVQSFPEAFKAAHLGKLQFAGFGWTGDDPDDFMRLFYGPNSGAGNLARFRNAEFDALFEKTHLTADDAERNRLYELMTKIVSAQAPWCINAHRISNTVAQPWIRGYRKNAHFLIPSWWYLDVDTAVPKSRQR